VTFKNKGRGGPKAMVASLDPLLSSYASLEEVAF